MAYGNTDGVSFKRAMRVRHDLTSSSLTLQSMASGASGTNFDMESGHVENNTAQVAEILNCPDDSMAALACMRNASLDVLLQAELKVISSLSPQLGIFTFNFVVDGDFIPDRPSELIWQERFAKSKSPTNGIC